MLTNTVTQIQPPRHPFTEARVTSIVLDLETGDAPAEAVAEAMAGWKAPGNIKDPDKIAQRKKEAAEKLIDQAALLDASPILCVAVQTNGASKALFNGMDASAPEILDWPVIPCGDEKALLIAFRAWLDNATTPDTLIVGHNLREFDLPKLRGAYVRHRLRLPEIFKPRFHKEERAESVDTAALFKAFSMEHRDTFCPSLDTVAASFRIPRPKQHMSGADCPRLYRAGEYATVLTYCAVDVATTAIAYRLMTSQAPDLE